MPDTVPGPLAGVLVVEVGSFLAAPFAATQLADLGARVVKVETPGSGDFVRGNAPYVDGESSSFVRLNRNKESVALDLKSDEGRDAFRRLVARADVLVENLRPGAMRRMGLGYDDLAADNPGLVYASASGWGQDGPLAQQPGLDIMAQARSGLMSVTGFPDGGPAKVGVPVCDLMCAMYVALGVTAALRERDRSGQGQHLDVSLHEAGVALGVWEAGRWFGGGGVPGPQGSAHQSQAPYQAVVTTDGHVTIGANTPTLWLAFCSALGLDALPADPRFVDNTARMTHRDALVEAVEAVTATMSTGAVLDVLGAAGVPCAPIQTYDQVFTDPALEARDFFWDAEHPTLGAVRQVGSPMRFSRTPVRRGPAGPVLGADTAAVLAELAPTTEETP
ncbi:CaiB/BaiF CoA transferase family protein [Nocardioides sp. AX2bis]|uniref:CaiB/BaiF CoA transferase family protein n=1 Tax=Nocardioides sp. AX2bis TaxID=2653157 RepID=UPI0012F12E5A|nr:CoA transferase [Nocardioides sp. AX2bis]VXC03104.1 Formyl-CoA transferase [Nocardioides sp. AX2bis]